MLEHMFSEQAQEIVSSTNGKKRKAQTPTPTVPVGDLAADIDDEDDGIFYGFGMSKKAKGGIGYAGNAREDVSNPNLYL